MANNALFDLVQKKSWHRAQEWNPLAEELRPLILSFVDELLPRSPVPKGLAAKIRPALAWDIMGICLEWEYKDLVQPFFDIPLLEPWYASGHFPCGWDGEEFPEDWDGVVREGKLIVF